MSAEDDGEVGAGNVGQLQGNDVNGNPPDANDAGGQGAWDGGAADGGQDGPPAVPAPDAAPAAQEMGRMLLGMIQVRAMRQVLRSLLQRQVGTPTTMQRSQTATMRARTIELPKRRQLEGAIERALLKPP